MQGSLVRVMTPDGIELQGLNDKGAGRAAHAVVVHLHGTWGNFYGNPFIDHFADFYPRRGYSFMTVNTRGHDEGSISERFENCLSDIQTWLEFAARLGYRRVILQGHSLGALEAVYYLTSSQSLNRVQALILLSPFDIIAFYCSGDITVRQDRLVKVKAIASTDPNALVPKDVWDMWLISAGTYLDLVDFNTKADIFPFRTGTLTGMPLSQVGLPVFAAVGGNDFAAFPSPKAEVEQLNQLPQVHAVLINGAPHNFAQHEGELLNKISSWLKRIKD